MAEEALQNETDNMQEIEVDVSEPRGKDLIDQEISKLKGETGKVEVEATEEPGPPGHPCGVAHAAAVSDRLCRSHRLDAAGQSLAFSSGHSLSRRTVRRRRKGNGDPDQRSGLHRDMRRHRAGFLGTPDATD